VAGFEGRDEGKSGSGRQQRPGILPAWLERLVRLELLRKFLFHLENPMEAQQLQDGLNRWPDIAQDHLRPVVRKFAINSQQEADPRAVNELDASEFHLRAPDIGVEPVFEMLFDGSGGTGIEAGEVHGDVKNFVHHICLEVISHKNRIIAARRGLCNGKTMKKPFGFPGEKSRTMRRRVLLICEVTGFRASSEPLMKSILLACALAAIFTGSLFAQTSALAPLPPDGFVTLQQVVNDFATAEDAALQKYNGMRILVYGRVGEVTQSEDASGDPLAVFMRIPSQTTPDVKAVFGADDLPKIITVDPNHSKADVYHRNWEGDLTKEHAFIVKGENTGIRGTFDNFVAGDIILKNCHKLQKDVLLKKLAEHGIPTE